MNVINWQWVSKATSVFQKWTKKNY